MKQALLLGVLIGIIAFSQAQEMNKVIEDTSLQKEILINFCNRDAFNNKLFSGWFNEEYENYKIDEKTLSKIDFENNPQPEITVIFGSWCSDSRREVPRLYKILDKLEFDQDNLKLIAVNRHKEAEDVSVSEYNIELVPTIIVSENGVEKGRIIESPDKSLEKDILKILEGNE